MSKKITDEAVVSALITNGTMKAAAASVGLTERALYDRMKERPFIALYQQAKADIVRQATHDINSRLGAALEVVIEIMENKDNRPEIRLQAADKIFQYSDRFAKRLSMDEHTASLADSDFHIDL